MYFHTVAMFQTAELERDLLLENGQTLRAGSKLILCPPTKAELVRLAGQSLASAWQEQERRMTALQNQLINACQLHLANSRQLQELTAWAIERGYQPEE